MSKYKARNPQCEKGYDSSNILLPVYAGSIRNNWSIGKVTKTDVKIWKKLMALI